MNEHVLYQGEWVGDITKKCTTAREKECRKRWKVYCLWRIWYNISPRRSIECKCDWIDRFGVVYWVYERQYIAGTHDWKVRWSTILFRTYRYVCIQYVPTCSVAQEAQVTPPEMVFGLNQMVFFHSKSGISIQFNAIEALKATHFDHQNRPAQQLKVKLAKKLTTR